MKEDARKLLFGHSSMENVVSDIFCSSLQIEAGKIEWNHFPDGFPQPTINSEVQGRDVVFIASFHNPAVIFEQLAVICALPRSPYLAKSLHVVLPFFPGTMDRVDEYGQIVTAKTLARMLSDIPLTKDGPARISIFDIHALQEAFYFGDNVIPELKSTVHLLKWQLRDLENIAIAFPDDGAYKRFGKMFPTYPKVICNKVRRGDERIVTVKEGDPVGKDIVIVDDLIQTGGTLIECRNALVEAGAFSVSVFAPHGICPDNTLERFSPDLFKKFWITDSFPTNVEKVRAMPNGEVLPISKTIVGLIR